MAITTRETTATGVTNKGSPLTNAEVDTNFIELQQDKIELTDLSVTTNSAGTAALTYTNTTGVFTYTPPDLSGYLTSEANDLTASVTWANVPDANITQSSVTQHQAALSITESQISDLGSYIELADLSVGAEGAASGDGSISYDNTTGVFTYTPPADISGAVTFAAKAGEALTKGDVVYVSGVSGNTPVVSKADANDASKMPAYGLAEADASLNAAVNVITFGTLYNLDTSGFSAGDTVYVSTTAGAITSTAPTGESSLLQNIGTVIRSHASAGSIKVGGAGRTNATPNLNDGNVFIGNGSNQAVARALTGDDISGGTITSFASTGIDDNATSTAITIDASENVGIGTTSPATPLHINGTTAAQIRSQATTGYAGVHSLNNSGNFYQMIDDSTGAGFSSGAYARIMYSDGAYPMAFYTNANERLRIDSSGRVGIGTTSPEFGIHYVSGTSGNTTVLGSGDELALESSSDVGMTFRGGTGNFATMYFAFPSDTYRGFIQYSEADDYLRFGTAKTERMKIDSSGRVGIGVSSPAEMLDINEGSTATYIRLRNATNTTGYIGYGTSASATDMTFWTDGTKQVTIDGSGNVGIGTTNPNYPLHLNKSDSAGCWAQFTNSTTGTGTGAGALVGIDSNEDFRILQYEAKALTLYTSATERMRIDSNGQLKIGGTTNSPANVRAVLFGTGNASLIYDTGHTGLHINNENATAGVDNYGAGISFGRFASNSDDQSAAIVPVQTTSDQDHMGLAFLTHNTNTRANPLVESMRIDSSGHLIIPNGVTLGTSAGVYNAANTLDDYEEGTWTPTVSQGSATFTGARYVKVGRLVYAEVLVTAFTNRTTAANIQVGGLPFTSSSDSRAGNVSLSRHINRSSGTIVSFMGMSRSYLSFYALATNADYEVLYHSHLSSTNSNIYISITYETT